MTVSMLIVHLQQLWQKHGDLEIIYDRCSDYEPMNIEDVEVVTAVTRGSGAEYIMRAHPSMPEVDKAVARQYIHFPGN